MSLQIDEYVTILSRDKSDSFFFLVIVFPIWWTSAGPLHSWLERRKVATSRHGDIHNEHFKTQLPKQTNKKGDTA